LLSYLEEVGKISAKFQPRITKLRLVSKVCEQSLVAGILPYVLEPVHVNQLSAQRDSIARHQLVSRDRNRDGEE
jgi:hypothetical protein